MSTSFRFVQWNTHKKIYDLLILACVAVFFAGFVAVGMAAFPQPNEVSPPILVMRALGGCAVLMLHVILAIGPLARLTSLAAPLLYNRRHLGVAFFGVCAIHALVAIGFYGGFGRGTWILNVVGGGYRHAGAIPFELFGFLALVIFFIMAATSHDFWLGIFGARTWKTLHMLVYAAYALVVIHIMLGAAQERTSPIYALLLGAGAIALGSLHIASGVRSWRADSYSSDPGEWIDAGDANSIPVDRARVVPMPTGDSIAVFRHTGGISAISNVCVHQGGPLGEGKIIDGCATCPWHGYQYRAEDGCSPPPYTEKISTYQVRIEGERVLVRSQANDPGTPVQPARPETSDAAE